MNIKEILEANGIEGEAIGKIEKAINKAVGDEFVDKQRYKDKLTEIETLKNDLQTAKDDLTTAGTWEQKYNDEVSAHNTTKSTYTAEKEADDIDGKVAAQLKAAGMNEKAIPKALKLYDRAIVERDKDGGIKNADKVMESFKSEWGDFFGEVQQQGADVGNPLANNSKPDYVSRLKAARESKDTQAAVRIKQEAATEGVYLI